jgi:hypothetical protein
MANTPMELTVWPVQREPTARLPRWAVWCVAMVSTRPTLARRPVTRALAVSPVWIKQPPRWIVLREPSAWLDRKPARLDRFYNKTQSGSNVILLLLV